MAIMFMIYGRLLLKTAARSPQVVLISFSTIPTVTFKKFLRMDLLYFPVPLDKTTFTRALHPNLQVSDSKSLIKFLTFDYENLSFPPSFYSSVNLRNNFRPAFVLRLILPL